jgi:arabinogalactan oligomer/maltooligosaccharide transport system permease protein
VANQSDTLVQDRGLPESGGPAKRGRRRAERPSTTAVGQIFKIVLLGLTLGIAIFGAFPLIEQGAWVLFALLVAVTALIFYVYLSKRTIPAKYLLPGTLFLVVFQIFPIIYTMTTAFTNFGDGHRGSKQDAIAAIESASFTTTPGAAQYVLTIAAEGSASGDLAFLLTDPTTKSVSIGTADGLTPAPAGVAPQLASDGKVTSINGYTILNLKQAAERSGEIQALQVPSVGGSIKAQGLSAAFQGAPRQTYDEGCDCIRDASTGATWTADDSNGLFKDAQGQTLTQGWKVNVGFRNFATVLSDPVIAGHFLRILLWNFAFAILTVLLTFAPGLLIAVVLNYERLKGQRIYRSLLILPYAMPAIVMYLLWRDMFNTDFGLINRLFHTDVNWFGQPVSSMIAILLVQTWLGYPYMFLVATGALQAIPSDLKEAAAVDGAKPSKAFRTIVFPLLLVALAPLLIASFAFNFNNFNAIYLTSEGGPFPADSPQAGATDLLITYTYRIAFGGQGAQYGLAAAISIFIFLIVAIVSIVGFRRTHVLEEIN